MVIEIHKDLTSVKDRIGVRYFILMPGTNIDNNYIIWDNGLFDVEIMSELQISYQLPNLLKNTAFLNIVRPVVAFLKQLRDQILADDITEVTFKGKFILGSLNEFNFLEYEDKISLDHFLNILFRICKTLNWGVKFNYEYIGIEISNLSIKRYSFLYFIKEILTVRKQMSVRSSDYSRFLYLDGLFEIDSLRSRVQDPCILTRNRKVAESLTDLPVIHLTGGLTWIQKLRLLKNLLLNIVQSRAQLCINGITFNFNHQLNKILLSKGIIKGHVLNYNLQGEIFSNKTFGYDLSLIFEVASETNLKLTNVQQAGIENEFLPNYNLAHNYLFSQPDNFSYYKARMKSVALLPIINVNRKKPKLSDSINVVFYLQPEKYHLPWKIFFETTRLCPSNNINYWLRPHYRSDENLINLILKNYPNLSLHQYGDSLHTCDLAVGFNSSVLYHATALQIPSLLIDSDLKSAYEKQQYLRSFSDRYSEQLIAEIASNYSSYLNSWRKRYINVYNNALKTF